MLFSSIVFLSIFFPSLVFIYFTVKKSFRSYILLIYSLIVINSNPTTPDT